MNGIVLLGPAHICSFGITLTMPACAPVGRVAAGQYTPVMCACTGSSGLSCCACRVRRGVLPESWASIAGPVIVSNLFAYKRFQKSRQILTAISDARNLLFLQH